MGTWAVTACYLAILQCTVALGKFITPCHLGDNDCVTASAKEAITLITKGLPELGIETVDPLHLDVIEGNLSVLKFKLTNTTVFGFKNCDLSNIKLDMDKLFLNIDLLCHDLYMVGDYEVSGRLILLPVEGSGPYRIDSKLYFIGLDTDIKKVVHKDGIPHLSINKFKLRLEAQGPIKYDLKNLFNGHKELADPVLQFANSNWKEVADFVQVPIFKAYNKKMVSIANKFLKTIPYDDLFL